MEEADPNKDEVFVSGLPLDITEQEIADYFGQIGVIKEVSKIIGNLKLSCRLGNRGQA
jgi:RNA recognition motif-containing protein